MVTVHPTHRRRGVLRRVMDAQLDDVARRGEPLAGLTASEASIYERFGYGTATFTTDWELESEYARLHDAPSRRRRACAPRRRRRLRPRAAHDGVLAHRADARRRAHAVPSSGGRRSSRRGRVARASSPRSTRVADRRARRVRPLRARPPLARRASPPTSCACSSSRPSTPMPKRRCGSTCSASTWSARSRPSTDRSTIPLRWRLPDRRRMRVRQLRDHLWVRVVDVAAALGARTYSADDAARARAGRRLPPREQRPAGSSTAGPDGATCTRTDRAADLVLSARRPRRALPRRGAGRRRWPPPGACDELTSGAVAPRRPLLPRRTRRRGAPRTSDPRGRVPRRTRPPKLRDLDRRWRNRADFGGRGGASADAVGRGGRARALSRATAFSCAIASMGPGSTSLSSAR